MSNSGNVHLVSRNLCNYLIFLRPFLESNGIWWNRIPLRSIDLPLRSDCPYLPSGSVGLSPVIEIDDTLPIFRIDFKRFLRILGDAVPHLVLQVSVVVEPHCIFLPIS